MPSGFDGCNSYGGRSEDGGSVADADGVFSLPLVAVTVMLCLEPEGVMDQAGAYMSALFDGVRYRVAGERLEILDGDGAVRLVFVSRGALEGSVVDLSGTAWRLVMDDGDARAATLVFLDDRLVVGDTACRPLPGYLQRGSGRCPLSVSVDARTVTVVLGRGADA